MKIKRVEHEATYSLEVLEVRNDSGDVVVVPIVNRWIQISIRLKRAPRRDEGRLFLLTLATSIGALAKAGHIGKWFFLHKDPGLRIRIEIVEAESAMLGLLPIIECFNAKWISGVEFDSYLGHRELLSGAYSIDVDRLLAQSTTEYCDALNYDRLGTADEWSLFTTRFLVHFLRDRWLAWEALVRLQRLRSQVVLMDKHPGQRHLLLSPSAFFVAITDDTWCVPSPGFEASTALLQCLNYIYNQWILDVNTQRDVIALAQSYALPELCRR